VPRQPISFAGVNLTGKKYSLQAISMIFIFLQLFFKIAPFLSEIHPMSAELFWAKTNPVLPLILSVKQGTGVSGIF